jgi:hypothetical protein
VQEAFRVAITFSERGVETIHPPELLESSKPGRCINQSIVNGDNNAQLLFCRSVHRLFLVFPDPGIPDHDTRHRDEQHSNQFSTSIRVTVLINDTLPKAQDVNTKNI